MGKIEISCSKSLVVALNTSNVILRKFFNNPDVVWGQFNVKFENLRIYGLSNKRFSFDGLVKHEGVVYNVNIGIYLKIGMDAIWRSQEASIICYKDLESKMGVIFSEEVDFEKYPPTQGFYARKSYDCDNSQSGLPVFYSF